MTYEQPPRLKYGDEFGALLKAADVDTVTADRLATNAAGYKALIATGATTALWKLIVPLVLLAILIIPVGYKLTREPTREAPVTSVSPEHAAHVEDVDIRTAGTEHEPAVTGGDPSPEPARVARRPAAPSAPSASLIAQITEPPAVPAPSELPEQIRLYELARDAARRGDHREAVARIDELLQRFPTTQLRAEAQLTRTESLARGNRFDEAVKALEQLIADDTHRGRRGELLRTLGDLHRRRGDCTHAVDAYTRALAQRLTELNRSEITRARDLCTTP
jgi:tetratricopeptide (TPR) repeat protein